MDFCPSCSKSFGANPDCDYCYDTHLLVSAIPSVELEELSVIPKGKAPEVTEADTPPENDNVIKFTPFAQTSGKYFTRTPDGVTPPFDGDKDD